MILSRHLLELVNFRTPSAAVISVYLDVDDGRAASAAYKTLRKTLERAVPADDLAALDRAVAEHARDGERGLAIFSALKFGLMRVCPLPYPVKTRFVVDETPFLRPLLNMTDQHQRYGVALVGAKRARLLEFYMGRARELDEHAVRAAELPHKGRAAYAQAVAERLEQVTRQLGFQRLIVSASPEIEKDLLEALPRGLQDNLIVDRSLGEDLPLHELRLKVAEADGQARKVREQVLAHRLLDTAGASSLVGLTRVLEAVEQGRVKTLLLRDGFAKLGRCCSGCKKLSLTQVKCVWCGAATETVFNLVEELADRALAQGAEVFRLDSLTPLDNLGHIGCELRLAASASAAAKTAAQAAAQGQAQDAARS